VCRIGGRRRRRRQRLAAHRRERQNCQKLRFCRRFDSRSIFSRLSDLVQSPGACSVLPRPSENSAQAKQIIFGYRPQVDGTTGKKDLPYLISIEIRFAGCRFRTLVRQRSSPKPSRGRRRRPPPGLRGRSTNPNVGPPRSFRTRCGSDTERGGCARLCKQQLQGWVDELLIESSVAVATVSQRNYFGKTAIRHDLIDCELR